MAFPDQWDITVGNGEARRTIIDPLAGSGSLLLSVSAENNVHLTIPEGSLQHGLLGAQYRFIVNVQSGTGSSNFIRAGLCFMQSIKDITTLTPSFYYVGLRLNADDGSAHRIFLHKVVGGTLYTTGSALVSPVVGSLTGYDQSYPMQIVWRVQGANLSIEVKVGTLFDYSDLVTVISLVDTGALTISTNESFFIKSEAGVTSATALIDRVDVKQIL